MGLWLNWCSCFPVTSKCRLRVGRSRAPVVGECWLGAVVPVICKRGLRSLALRLLGQPALRSLGRAPGGIFVVGSSRRRSRVAQVTSKRISITVSCAVTARMCIFALVTEFAGALLWLATINMVPRRHTFCMNLVQTPCLGSRSVGSPATLVVVLVMAVLLIAGGATVTEGRLGLLDDCVLLVAAPLIAMPLPLRAGKEIPPRKMGASSIDASSRA